MRKANPGILDSNGEVMYGSLSQSLVKTATETMQRSLDLYEQSKSSPLKKIVRSRSGEKRNHFNHIVYFTFGCIVVLFISASGSTRRRRSSISLSKSMEMPSNIEVIFFRSFIFFKQLFRLRNIYFRISPSIFQHWVKTSIYGAFFFDDDDDTGIISHQYLLNIPQDTSVYVTIKSTLNRKQSFI